MLHLGKVNFKSKEIKRDKASDYILVMGKFQQEEVTIINIHEPNNGSLSCTEQILLGIKDQINMNTIIMGRYQCHTIIKTQIKQAKKKIKKEISDLRKTFKQMDLMSIYSVSPRIPLLSTRTSSQTDSILINKANLSRCEIFEIIPYILSNHSTMKLKINGKENRKYANVWKLSS